MQEIREKIINSCANDNFLNTIYEINLHEAGANNFKNVSKLMPTLIQLNNEGTINLVSEFLKLRDTSIYREKLYLLCNMFQQILPEINNEVKEVMECVLHLNKIIGNELSLGSFMLFCSRNSSRASEVLNLFNANTTKWIVFILPAIIAGCKEDLNLYLDEAIKLSQDPQIEIRKTAIHSLGYIEYNGRYSDLNNAMFAVTSSVENEIDNDLLAILIKTAFALYNKDNDLLAQTASVMEKAAAKCIDSPNVFLDIFERQSPEIPEALMELFLSQLERLNPLEHSVVDQIDYGFARLFGSSHQVDIISIMARILPKFKSNLPQYSLIVKELYSNKSLLQKIITRWFLTNDRDLHELLEKILCSLQNKEAVIEIDRDEVINKNQTQLVFFTKKVVGYLFLLRPILAANIILSLFQYCDDQTCEEVENVFYDFLVIGYPEKMKILLECRGSDKTIIKLLNKLNNYQNGLTVNLIPELHPSPAQVEAQDMHRADTFASEFERARKQMPFLSHAQKISVLSGKKAIMTIYPKPGETKQIEMPMHSSKVEITYPSQSCFYPVRLYSSLMIFKLEQYV